MRMDDEHIDLTRPEFWMADPYPTYHRLRAAQAVSWEPQLDAWL